MFAQCGLLDAIKPFFLGYGSFLVSSKIVNSTTLRYLKLVESKKIIHPTHPLLLRETEENIAESRLVHVSDRIARIVAEAHAEFLRKLGAEVGTGESAELTVRQSRILEQPSRVYLKRKNPKNPGESGSKKVAKTKKTTGPRKPRKVKVSETLLEDVTEAEKEQAELAAALEKIEALKEKEKLLENTYDSGIDPKEFEDMYSKLPPLTGQWTMYGTVNGKIPDTIINSTSYRNVFQ
jgi:hypothetical protein